MRKIGEKGSRLEEKWSDYISKKNSSAKINLLDKFIKSDLK